MHIPKLRYILTVLLALFGVAIWGFSTTKDSYAQTSPIKLFDAIPATGDTGEIFKSNLIVNFSSGRIILSGNDQGTGRMYVDDILYIRVTRPDSSIVTYTHFLDFNYSPVDLTDYFQIGSNQVRVRIENTGGPGEASAHWLVNLAPTPVPLPYQIVDEIPTAPVASGSFYARYFYVDYSGSGRMLLSADSNGQGIATVTDRLVVQVWRPDGTMRRYERDDVPLSVMDLTEYFQTGRNLVHFRLENSGASAGSTPFRLVHLPVTSENLPFRISPAIPTFSPTNGDVFGRYFWVNVQEGQNLFLSSSAEGVGQLSVTGFFDLRVVHPDGSQVKFVQADATSNPVDISAYFETGLNLVHAKVQKTGASVGIDAIYLTQSGTPIKQQNDLEPGWLREITAGFPSLDREDGAIFFDQTFELDYRKGIVILAQYANGQGTAYVDDRLLVDIIRPDNTVRSFSRTYHFSPIDFTWLLQVGRNNVRIRLQETGYGSSSTSLWFRNLTPTTESLPFKITDAIPGVDRTDGIDFFSRQFFVNYDGDGRLMLAAYADGTENYRVDDSLEIWFTHPDGTVRYVTTTYAQAPIDLTGYFAVGKNLLAVALTETGYGSSSSSLWLSQMQAKTVTVPFRITPGFAGGDREDGHQYLGRSFFINSSGANSTALSLYADGTGNITVDDRLLVDVYRADGSWVRLTKSEITFPPVDIEPYLNIGLNRIYVSLVETGYGSSASSIWLSQKTLPLPPAPTHTPTIAPTATYTPTPCPTDMVLVNSSCATFTPTFTPIPPPPPTDTPVPPPPTHTSTPETQPVISEIRPKQGRSDAPNTIRVYGRNFADGAGVSLDSTQLSTTFVSSSQLQAEVPANLPAGVYAVTVVTPDGGRATLADAYTVFDPASNDDLSANDYELWSDPAALHANAETKLHLLVRRQGGKTALSNVIVRFYLGNPASGGTLLGVGTVAVMSPRAFETTSAVLWKPQAAGAYDIYAVIDPDNAIIENYENNNVVHRLITVLPAAADLLAPHVDSLTLNSGANSTTNAQVTLTTLASDPDPSSGLSKLLFQEFEFSEGANQWVPVRSSGWLAYASAKSNHLWQLAPSSGMKYLQAWAADGAGNVSLFPARTYVNFLPDIHKVGFDQRKLYRYQVAAGQTMLVRLEPVSGDPDLYLWPPDHATRPPWVSNLPGSVDDLTIVAPIAGMYQIEVHGFSAAEYRLIVEIKTAGEIEVAQISGGVDPNKQTPAQPPVANNSTPLPVAIDSPGIGQQTVFLPLVRR